jgi:hypothetical protein
MRWDVALRRLRRNAASAYFMTIGGALAASPIVPAQEHAMTEAEEVVGNWERTEAPPCAAQYPSVLTFQPGGLYRGTPAPPGQFAIWDVGTWKLTPDGAIAISTANDAVIAYRFALSGDELRFEDQAGCRFAYRRVR